ncbi:hypothetical protein ACGC1H_002463 [Rhizoctonia solani]|uniref:CHAT domain-containing protein n=1 Tax=Rhizoctonia solani TaxID=456999 RepID=A0A8H3GG80_9AGAM|nr:unnamed protein product [Rhizoctonia solani]
MQHELGEINERIESISRTLSHTPDDDPDMRDWLAYLGDAHRKRYDLLQELDDIQKMIEYTAIAVSLTPDEDENMPLLLSALGSAYAQRFQQLGEVNDIEKALEYTSLSVALIPNDHPDLPRRLINLAISYRERYERLGEPEDIGKAIGHSSQAIAATPDDHPSLINWFGELGAAYGQRFQRMGDLDDLANAIEHQTCGLALAPDGHPHLPILLGNLATCYSLRFQRLGLLDDLEKAIEYESRALDLSPDDHRLLSTMFTNLGVSYNHRFEHLGELNDLEKAIEYEHRALALTADGHPQLSGRLVNLGISYNNRFQRLGELDNIEKAIEYQSRALALTPDGHPDMSSRLEILGKSHSTRFQRLGELDDIEKAIEYQSRALTLTHADHPHLSLRLANLGVSHRYRYERIGELKDLEKAIEYESCAVELAPENPSDFSTMLTNLGLSHKKRFELLGELDDLEKAMEYDLRALALMPDGHPQLPGRLVNLGGSHGYRFKLLGALSDLEKDIECQTCALELTSDDHPSLCLIHCNLALAHVWYYDRTIDSSHLEDSLHSFRVASKSAAGAPRDRFHFARRWAIHASGHTILNPIEAYQTAIDLLPQFIWLGATTNQRYQDLLEAQTLAIDAAAAAVISADYALALEWLEHARCIVWNQNLMLRSPLDQLEMVHPALAVRLQTIANELHRASSESREFRTLSSGSVTTEEVGQQHRRLAKEYNELLMHVRRLPGFEDFLQPIKVSELVCAARNGPIIAINCHDDRCDALVILPKHKNVAHIPLPNFTAKKARDARAMIEASLKRQGLRERGVRLRREPGEKDGFGSALAMLWNDLVKPTLDFLGYTNTVAVEHLPHITWCPTGAASFLPLHAAGDYDQPHSRIFDYVISSYTPTLTALLACTPSTLSSDSRVLAVGQQATPGQNPLPGTMTELKHVRSHVGNKAVYSQLIEAQATPPVVLDAMERHDWVHLACHAHQNVNDPTKSGFFLHEGTLDLAAINRRSFNKKGLAFLSACQTATGDEALPDEAVHLASGMLMAGYSSVIATMWSVVDEDAPFVADKVYSQLMVEGKIGNGEAGKALHNAVAGLREKVGEKKFGRWVPYIHIGS